MSKSSKANREHVARFVLLALYTGTRSSAVLSLSWDRSDSTGWVDLEGGVIYRRGNAESDRKNKRRPPVKIPTRLLGHLKRWRRRDLKREKELQKHDGDSRLTNVIHHGGAPIVTKISRSFAKCVADAGLSDEITPHWLRHTAATWLMEAGVDLWLAAGYLGMTTATLEVNYGHHRPDFQVVASLALNRRR